ncbi:MAG: hypothetical protein M1281_03915 [Chloroflexi bacterium]|nr:hypothetical protein [Chloroflexota bacterium]
MLNFFKRASRSIRALARAFVFLLKVYPMLPSRPIDWVTKTPTIDKVRYPTRGGFANGDLYRPSTGGPFPGILLCLGVVPFEVDHPQVPILGRALARAGFAALMYWSPAMRDFRLDPEDIENIALAYDWFVRQPQVDPARSGMFGTCVGGSFALMTAASPLIRDRVGFAGAYAPFSSMRIFARDVAGASCSNGDRRKPWRVDQLTRKVFVHSITAELKSSEAERLRLAFSDGRRPDRVGNLSADGKSVFALLAAQNIEETEQALENLPSAMLSRLEALSPLNYLRDIHVPLIVMLHDVGDQVIPVGESRRLYAAFNGRAGVYYTEMAFSHLDPVKGKLPLWRLVRELVKMFRAVLPMFEKAV